ncbi:NAD(P)H-hydrate dehydratase [Falsiphaeobacter marinintestinus]|uniref:NAD(P)H-hydrate dehydratase n=1 Tax=Falsiphaeobacter marinintestinus TaxID=1492905 RepID=UPI0011B7DF20|nr:NAD(P)H-hydrate dehydratase [Phaeobacter marinintestinus]
MTELLTAAQMRAIEQAAIASGEVTGLELMERAGQGVVEAIYEGWQAFVYEEESTVSQFPDCVSQEWKRAVVLCGPGNNGGDGFVVARLLKERGWDVEVFLYGDAETLPPDARANYDRWSLLGCVKPLKVHETLDEQCSIEPVIAVDALFGTGLTRPLEAGLLRIVSDLYQYEDFAVSVDIPSGFCADSGKLLGADSAAYAIAPLVVTFQRAKLGHFLEPLAKISRKLVEVDIGLESQLPHQMHDMDVAERTLVNVYTRGIRRENGHKYTHGHALMLSGGAGTTGAARLAARGALRIGAGLVTLAVPGSAQMEVACQITALMLKRADDAAGLDGVLGDTRLNALCLGPGLGIERARDLVPTALKATRATVLDADALTAFADAPDDLFGMLHRNCVLTPHGGEFARLFPDIAAKLNETPVKGPAYSKVDATRAAAKRAGCTVLFKGPDTVIADETGTCSVNAAVYDRAAPWLATAGSGDVLAGFITGLLARGFKPIQAAETAAWLHVECALQFGPGLIAEDLPEQLPAVFRSLGA